MRRLLLAAAVLAALPTAPSAAGPAACVAAAGFPVCAGTCSPGDTITVTGVGTGATQGVARCGDAEARCTAFRAVCLPATDRTTTGGPLTCGGSAQVVICYVGTQSD